MLRERLTDDLKSAMKAKDSTRLSTLRLALTAIKERDIEARATDNPDGITDQDILGVLGKMIKQRNDSAKIYEEGGRLELAERELAEIQIINDYLPEQMSDAEMEQAVSDVIAGLDASGLKDMGRVMAALKEKFAGQMDFSKASILAKNQLS